MSFPDAERIEGETDMADDMDMSHNPAQLEMWKLLGESRVVVDAVTERLVRPGKVNEPHATGPARLEAQIKKPGSAGALDLGKSGAAFPKAGAAKGKARIIPARHGNAFVVVRRRD